MLIENPDAFRAWLTSVLEPLCDADPEALAKYVYALVRKERPVEALREGMVEQLDVFLQKETKPFVELLFKTLEKQEYLQQPATPIPNANPPNPNIPAVATKPDVPEVVTTTKEVKPIIPVSSLPDLTLDPVNGTTTAVSTTAVKKDLIRENDATVPHRKEREHKKSESEKDEKAPAPIRAGRLRHRSNSRNRSRSRSWDRSRRSKSRDRSRERERRDRSRPWRNKSPPRRYERRRSRSNSPIFQRNRSPRHSYRGRYRNRSPPRSHSRSRSRSLDKDKKDHKEPLSGAGTPTQDSNHGDTDMRLISSTQSIQSVVANPDVNSAGGNFVPNNAIGPVFHGKRRCRDFDEKGYCMRGDMCPYDHGVDPVVLENTALSNVLTFGPNGQPPLEGPPATEMLPPQMIRPNSGHVMHGHHMPHRPMHPGIPPEYNPSAPSMWNRSGFRGGPIAGPPRPGMFHGGPGLPLLGGQPQGLGAPPGPHNHVQRELISVPVLDNSAQHINDVMYPHTSDYMSLQENMGMKKKPGFDFNRLGPRTKNPENCSLELKKVPRGLNNITHLNNHFSKFGKIVNIQVNYEGDPEAALITFSSHAEANAAHRSTEAVLNNRFIKIFWHTNGDGKQENVPPRSVKERLGGQTIQNASPNTNKVLNLVQPKASTPGVGTTTTEGNANSNEENTEKNNVVVNNTTKSLYYIPSSKKEILADSRAQQNAAIKKSQEILAATEQLKKKQEEKRKEAVKLTQDLIKRKQELLDKQLTQQKVLFDKFEKVPKGPQRDSIKDAIHTLQQSIENIRESLVDAVKQRGVGQVSVAAKISQTRKSKDEAQKELLDAELDLITKQQEGADTSDLQKKVFELKKHAQKLGIPLNSRRGTMPPVRIPRGYKFIRGNRHSFANASVDHRPTKLLVSGYEFEEKTDVLAHFAQYGEISDYVSDDSTPSVVLNFKTRKEAEVAMLKGKHFQDRTLSVTWCTNVQLSNQLSTNRRDSRAVLLSESDEDHLLDSIPEDELNAEGVDLSEEALLQDDEEEEEENEEGHRSWRR